MTSGATCTRILRASLAAAALLFWAGAASFAQDITAPGSVAGSSASPASPVGALTLYWGAAGDDGDSGALAAGSTFYIQYSTYAGAAWAASSAQVVRSTSGVTPLSPVSHSIGGLDPGATYYLAVWHRDEAGNLSAISNIASAYARPFPAVTINKSVTGTGTWHVNFSPGADGYTSGMASDLAGNTYVSGFINNGSNVDIFIHKYDPSGNLLLAKYYNGEENRSENHLPAVAVDTASGDFYMLGAESKTSPAEVSLLIKYDASGQMVWKRTTQGNSATEGQAWNDAKVDASGNIYVCGSISNGSDKNSLARKYDPAGNLVWASTYAFSGSYDWCTGLALSGGYVYGSGTADMAGIGQGQNVTAWKLDINTGLIQWTTYYTGAANRHDDGADIVADAGGNIYIVGDEQVALNDYSRLTQKRNSSGVIQWTFADNYTAGSGMGEGYKRAVISADNYIYEVGLASAGVRGMDVNVSKRDLNGNLAGTYLYDLAGGSDLGFDLQIVGDKLVIAGEEVTGGLKRHFVRKINLSEVMLPDTTAPAQAAVTASSAGYVGGLTLYWGAPGDDGGGGALAAGSTFYIQYSTYAGAAWSAASAQVVRSTSGVTPSNPVSYSIGGLDPGTTYYLAVWHRDEAGNLSPASNIASAYARPFPPPVVSRTVNGDGAWKITLPAVSNYFTNGLAADATGNIYAAGTMHSGINEDIFVHKYDPSGNLLLAKYYNGEDNFPDSAYPVVAVDTVTGAFYLVGHEFGTYPDAVGLVIKYDASGQMVWKSTAQGNSATNAQGLMAVALDSAGNVYVGGQLSNGGERDSFVRKYTPSGTEVWSSTRAFAPNYDWITGLAVRDGYVYAVGSADMSSLGQGQNATFWKLDMNTGLTAWTTYYNGAANRHDEYAGVSADASGSLYLAGQSQVALGDYAMLLQKRSAATGAVQWTSALNYTAGVQDIYMEVLSGEDGAIYAGGVKSLGANGNLVVSKRDAAGSLLGEYAADVDGGDDEVQNLIVSGGKLILSGYETYGGQKRHYIRQLNMSSLTPPDTAAPAQAILQPADGSYAGSLAAITGTAADNVAVSSVTVSLKRLSDNLYWSGLAWGASQTWLNAALFPSSWTYSGVPALSNGSLYTVVARAMDSSSNWATVYATSTFTYQFTPSAVSSLSGAPASYVGALALQWNAPGNDGPGGTLGAGSTFYIQYSTYAGAAWSASAAQVVRSTSGVTPLSPVAHSIGGLDPGATYYLAVWHRDEAGNLSAISNVASAYAKPFPALAINRATNPDGTWHVYFPAGTTRYVAGLAADASGYAYVAGHVSSGSNEDLFVHKYDQAGNLVMAKYYNGPDNCSEETDTSVAVDSVTGAFYLAGNECAAPSSTKRLIIKYDASGQLVWKRTADGGGWCGRSLVAVQVGADGNVYAAGNDNNNSLVAKYDPDGGLLWSYEHAFSGNCDITYGLSVRGGYVYAVGSADMSGAGRSQDGSFWKLNAATGETLLTSTYDLAHYYDEYFGVAVDTSGYLYVAGDAQQVYNDWALLTQKLDASGTPLWAAVENNSPSGRPDVYRGIVISTDNYLYQAGVVTDAAQGQDILVTKRGLDGTLLGITTVDVDGGEDAAHGLTLAGGNVVVYGHETLGGQRMHFVRSLKTSSLTLPDTAPPAQALLQPVGGSYLNSLAAISGTAADNIAVSSVTVSLKRQSDGYYWNGAAWAAPQNWLNAALWPSSWTYTALPAWASGASYTVTARAADTSNNWSTVYSTSVFYYDNGRPASAVSVPAAGSVATSFSGLTGTAADTEFQVSQVWVKVSRISDGKYWDGAAWTAAETWKAAAGTSAWTYSGLPASALDSGATYYAVSRAADLAGNLQTSEALVSTFSYLVQQLGPAPFTGVGISSLTVNWTTDFYAGTTYYLRLSTVPSEGQYLFAAATTSHSLAFTGLIPNTSYYAYVATAPAGGYVQTASGITPMETPTDIYFDEVEATRIVASAYAPTPAFHNLNLGQSGTNVAISSAGWTWAGWHGEKWTTKAPMPTQRSRTAVGRWGGKLYAVGGGNTQIPDVYSRTEEYDPASNTWTSRSMKPGYDAAAVGEIDGRLYVVGVSNPASGSSSETVSEYRPDVDSWVEISSRVTSRVSAAYAVLDERIYEVGGTVNLSPYTTKVGTNESFSPMSAAWESKAGMPIARALHLAVSLRGKLYVIGGYMPSAQYGRNDEYDPASDAWVSMAPMPTYRHSLSGGVVGGKLYALGGQDTYGYDHVDVNEEFDPLSNTWTSRAKLSSPRMSMGVSSSGGRLYVIGGYDDFTYYLATNEEYDPGVAGVFTGLSPNTLYSFKAKARNQAGVETGESVIVSTCTRALPPGSVAAAAVSSRAVSVSWDRGANPPGTMFEVSYSTVSSSSLACAGCVAALTEDASLLYTGLAPSTTYYFRVLAFNVLGAPTRATAAAPVLTLPASPGQISLAGTAAGVSSITWNWNAVPDVAGYRMFTSSGDNVSGDLGPGVQAWTEIGLSANTRYIRLVRADNASGFSASQEAAAYTLAAVPGVPEVTGRSDTLLLLDWTAGGNPEPGTLYQLWRSTSADFSAPAVSTASVSSAAAAGLQPDTAYYFKVLAVNGDGLPSAFSGTLSTATMAALPPAPPAPAGYALGVSSIAWSWSGSAAAQYYRVYGEAGLLASPATNYYARSGLAPNTTYSVTVAGVSELGEGQASPAAAPRATLAMPPAGAVVPAVYATSATLAWGLNGNPAGTSARVQRLNPYAVFSTQGISYTDTGLLACTSYYFRLWNVNRDGLSTAYAGVGPVFTGAVTPPPPGNLSAVSLAVSRISLSWEPSPYEGITAYNLYFDDGTGVINYSSPLATVPAAQSSYTTGVLTSSAAYKFGLRALHRCGVEEKNTTVIAAAPSVYSLTGVRAAIKIPQTGKRVNGNSVTVMAEQVTGAASELKNVRFQYKTAAGAAWLNIPAKDPASHPNPAPAPPYFIHWDVSALAAGAYNLRAVAYDLGNTADPAPAYITITVDPAEAEIVENVTGGKVTKEQVVNNLVTNVLQAGDPEKPQVTRLEIPAGALDASTATVAVTNNPAVLPPEPPDAEAAGVAVEVNLSGQSALAGGQTAVVTLVFPDADGDGMVDGTGIRANQLQMFSAHSAAGPWQRDLASEVDLAARKVTGRTSHFSFFALFAPRAADISSARAYPVPWRPGSGGRFDSAPGSDGITFDSLTDNAVVYIYTITGQLVRELRLTAADLGVKVWDGKNADGRKAASGVYLARIKSGSSVRTIKIVVER